jgi:plastocyanin
MFKTRILPAAILQARWMRTIAWGFGVSLGFGAVTQAQEPPVTVQISATEQKSHPAPGKDAVGDKAGANTVVWLTPVEHRLSAADQRPPQRRPRLTQHNKSFEPHMLVVEVGTTVDFPNKDPFFHNVFSLFDGKRFDLGLYEAGATNSARFERVGVSFLFCNIHPEMSAVVVAVDTPYFAIADRSGRASLANVPDGKYEMHVWSERALPEELKKQVHTVTISSANRTLPQITLVENPNINTAHKNKYGQDYVAPPDGTYAHP